MPYAPTNVAASYVSDASVRVTWTPPSGDYEGIEIERGTDGSWAENEPVAVLGTGYTAFVDRTVSANHRYRYRARSYGDGGYSSWQYSGYVYTTPAAPTGVRLAATSTGTAEVSADVSGVRWPEGYRIQLDTGDGWANAAVVDSLPATVQIASGESARARVRSIRGDLYSAWAESGAAIEMGALPTVANVYSVDGNSYVHAGATYRIGWEVSLPDGSDVVSSEVSVSVDGGTAQTVTVDGPATEAELTAPQQTGTLAITVRAQGAAGWSAWSGALSMRVVDESALSILAPADGSTVSALPVEITWTAADATGIAYQTLKLFDASGALVHRAQLDGDARSYHLGEGTYTPLDGTPYRLEVEVSAGNRLTTARAVEFSIAWAGPAAPVATVTVDTDRLSATVSVEAGENPSMHGTVPDAGIVRITLPNDSDYGGLLSQLRALPQGTYRAVARFELTAAPSGASPMRGIGWGETSASAPSDWIVPWSAWSSSEVGTVDEAEVEFDVPASASKPVRLHVFGAAADYSTPDGAATVSLDVYPVDVEGDAPEVLPATSTVAVVRVDADGGRWTVASGLVPPAEVTDPLPPIGVPYRYEVSSVAESGAYTTVEVGAEVDAALAGINFGPGAAELVVARLNPSWSESIARDAEVYHFADGGSSGLPVAYGGADVDITGSVKFTLLDRASLRRLRALAADHATCWVRDPYGGRRLCAASWGFSSGVPLDKLEVTANLTATVFEEAW